MRRKLPSTPLWLRPAAAFFWALFAGAALRAQDAADGSSEDPGLEVIKQLVFIEQHLYSAGVVDGIESPYDVKVSPDGGHVYVASLKNDAISYFERNETNGELTYRNFVTESDIGENALNGVRSLAMSPDGEFVYSVAMFSNSLASFDRDTGTGALSFLDAIYDSDGGVDGLDGPRSIAVSPDGKNLYVAAFDDGKLSVFSRNSVTGAASFLGVYEEGDQGVEELTDPHALVLSPDGKHLYVALWKNEIIVFSRAESTGLLTYKSRLAYLTGESKKESPRALAFSPDGKYLYVASANNDALSVLARDSATGGLTIASTVYDKKSGVSNLDGPHAISISSDGAYLYIAAVSSDSVTSFERNAQTGALVYYQSLVAGTGDTWDMNGPISIGTSPDGEHVYVGSGSGTHSVVTFRREVLVDPPEFVVQPIDQSIEEGESVAFYALAQGVDLSYRWLRGGVEIPGRTLPVLTLPSVALGDDGSEFSVKVSNAGGVLTSSPVTLTVLPPIVVNAPVDLTALDISSTSVRLSWKDESDNETSFEVQRRVPGGAFSGLVTVLENQVQYDDASLASSTTYVYRVRARRGESVSLWSNDAVIESYDDAPQSPVNLTVKEQTYNKVDLRWSDRSAVEDGFRVFRRLDEIGALWTTIATVDKDATNYVDRSVLAQSTYAYRIQAYNESGSSDYSNSVVAITSSIPVDSISPTSRTIPRDSISGYSIGVTSSKSWEALSSVDWLVVTSPAGGQGSGNQGVTYRSLLNESQNERSGKIVVGGIEHTVVQEGSPPFLRISPSRTEASAAATSKIVDIQSNVNWGANEVSDWVSITAGSSGSNYGSVVLSISENPSFNPRFAELMVNTSTHIIEQLGKVPSLELSADETRFTHEGGSGTVTVDANLGWSSSVSVDWISLVGETSGDGDGAVVFSVSANDTVLVRSADIVVNSSAISITQDPNEETPVLALSSDTTSFGYEAGSGTVAVLSNLDWTASVSESWITLEGATSGRGSGSIVFSVDSNYAPEGRSADIRVNDQTISIAQAPPDKSNVAKPAWVSVAVGDLGAELVWNDLSDGEIGFRIRRSVVGADRVFDVADLPAGTTTYFDRKAPRGKSVSYALVSYDALGESDEVLRTSDVLPAANMTALALHVEAADRSEALIAEMPFAGDGELVIQRICSGEAFGKLKFGGAPAVARYEVDTDAGLVKLAGTQEAVDWARYFSFAQVVSPSSFSDVAERVDAATQSVPGGSAFPRGARLIGQLLGPDSAMAVGFEIEGAMELPILIQAAGSSLASRNLLGTASDLKLELFEIPTTGDPVSLAQNADWATSLNDSTISWEDAFAQTGARSALSQEGGEARILAMLGPGRFVALLSSSSGSLGTAMFELLDAR